MTEMECKQAFAAMPAEQLLPNLHEVEKALNAVHPYAAKWVEIDTLRETANRKKDDSVSLAGGKKVSSILYFLGALLSFVLSLILSGFGSSCCKFISICAVLLAGTYLLQYLSGVRTIKKDTEALHQLENQTAEAMAHLEQAAKPYHDLLTLREWICPAECYNPKHMRVFVKFFEDGRADSLKEARNLFDEYMHRQRMENAANTQVAAANAAARAAYQAMIASQNAASTAQQAKNSADWAAYHARNK